MLAGAPPGTLPRVRVPGLLPLPLLSATDRFALEADDAVRRNLPGQMFFAYNAIHGEQCSRTVGIAGACVAGADFSIAASVATLGSCRKLAASWLSP
jgi:hypothetical protein